MHVREPMRVWLTVRYILASEIEPETMPHIQTQSLSDNAAHTHRETDGAGHWMGVANLTKKRQTELAIRMACVFLYHSA